MRFCLFLGEWGGAGERGEDREIRGGWGILIGRQMDRCKICGVMLVDGLPNKMGRGQDERTYITTPYPIATLAQRARSVHPPSNLFATTLDPHAAAAAAITEPELGAISRIRNTTLLSLK